MNDGKGVQNLPTARGKLLDQKTEPKFRLYTNTADKYLLLMSTSICALSN